MTDGPAPAAAAPAPLRIVLWPTASTAGRGGSVLAAAALAWALLPAGVPDSWRGAALATLAILASAGAAIAAGSTGVRWTVTANGRGATFEPWVGRPRSVPYARIELCVRPGRLTCPQAGADLALTPADASAIGAWLAARDFVRYGTTPGPVRHVPRVAVAGIAREQSPVPHVSNASWGGARPGRIAHAPWQVPRSLRDRAPGAVPGSPPEPVPADLVALGRDLDATPADPTAARSGDRVPVWPVCCGALAPHQGADPVHHELLGCMDEEAIGALERALVDPLLVAGGGNPGSGIAVALERAFGQAVSELRGGSRPRGLDVFRCAACRRIYAVLAP